MKATMLRLPVGKACAVRAAVARPLSMLLITRTANNVQGKVLSRPAQSAPTKSLMPTTPTSSAAGSTVRIANEPAFPRPVGRSRTPVNGIRLISCPTTTIITMLRRAPTTKSSVFAQAKNAAVRK
jgi:hypothetical protein